MPTLITIDREGHNFFVREFPEYRGVQTEVSGYSAYSVTRSGVEIGRTQRFDMDEGIRMIIADLQTRGVDAVEEWKQKYIVCRVCGDKLEQTSIDWNLRRFETSACRKPECCKQDDVDHGRLCCLKAEPIHCVCAYSYKCPDHGEHHIGTHD